MAFKPLIVALGVAVILGIAVTPTFANEPVYQGIIGSWTGTWKSNKRGSTGKVTFSCRRGSSLSPNCTARISTSDGAKTTAYEYAPDWKGNGKLEWKNGPLHYVFQLKKNGTLSATYKVRNDHGTWTFKRQ